MSKIISAELFKLKRNKVFWLIAIVMAGAMIAMTIYMPTAKSVDGVMASFSGLLPLFSIIVIVSLAQNDENSGTLKNTVSSGIGRYDIYFGRLISTLIAVLVLFVIDGVATIIAASVLYGVSIDAVFLIKSIAMQLLLAVNYTIVFYLIGTIISKGSFAIVISYILFLFDGLIFGTVGFLVHINSLGEFSMGSISAAIEKGHFSISTLGHLGILTVIFVVCAFVGAAIFAKKDVK